MWRSTSRLEINENEAGLACTMCETARPASVSISPTNSEEQRLVESVHMIARGSPLYESMLKSENSTFFSVRALRYVIFPIQVLSKSCKQVPVMLMGALMGKKYPLKKYLKVGLIVAGVGLFMGGR
jgi:hypothetical protein